MATKTTVNKNVLGAWIRLCQIAGNNRNISTKFDKKYSNDLINEIKKNVSKRCKYPKRFKKRNGKIFRLKSIF